MGSEMESEMPEGATQEPYAQDGYTGTKITYADQPIAQLDTGAADSISVTREGDDYVVSGSMDMTGEEFNPDTGDAATDEMSRQMMEGLDIKIAITFPGEVAESNGEVDGNTVTWTPVVGEVNEMTARGSALPGGSAGSGSGSGSGSDEGTDEGTDDGATAPDADSSDASGSSAWIWFLVGGLVLLGIIGLVLWLVLRSKPGTQDGQGTGFPQGGYPGQPGQPGQQGVYGAPGQYPVSPVSRASTPASSRTRASPASRASTPVRASRASTRVSTASPARTPASRASTPEPRASRVSTRVSPASTPASRASTRVSPASRRATGRRPARASRVARTAASRRHRRSRAATRVPRRSRPRRAAPAVVPDDAAARAAARRAGRDPAAAAAPAAGTDPAAPAAAGRRPGRPGRAGRSRRRDRRRDAAAPADRLSGPHPARRRRPPRSTGAGCRASRTAQDSTVTSTTSPTASSRTAGQ